MFPKNFFAIGDNVQVSGHDKEIIAESVDEFERFGSNFFATEFAVQAQHIALGTACHRACYVCLSRSGCSARQDESVVVRQGCVGIIYECFEPRYIVGCNCAWTPFAVFFGG